MKKIIILIILVNISIFAQSNSSGRFSKFGMGGGFSSIFFMPNYDGINSLLSANQLPTFSDGLFTYGGSGFAYVLFVRNLRIGGIGFGGMKSLTSNLNGYNQQVDYSLSGGGVTIEYTIPQISSFYLSVGGMLGFGSVELDFYNTGNDFDWNNLLSDSENKYVNMYSHYFIFAPTLNAEYLINRFMALRLGVGYQVSLGLDWQVYNQQVIQNMPNNINGNSFFIQAGILAGLFVY